MDERGGYLPLLKQHHPMCPQTAVAVLDAVANRENAAALREIQRALDAYASAIHCGNNPAPARTAVENLIRKRLAL